MGISADVFTHQRGDFRERLARLAGKTAYRVPMEGHSTAPLQLTDQDMAAALAYARRGRGDIGPDIAWCIVCQSDAYRRQVTRELACAMVQLGALARKHAQHLRAIAEQAFDAVVFQEKRPRPIGIPARAYDGLLVFAEATLWQAAESAIHRAERRFMRDELRSSAEVA